MHITFSDYDLSEFLQRPVTIAGTECVLIKPLYQGIKWTADNLIFRSSIWTKDGQLVSPSFKKFFNWGESSLITPPSTLAGCTVVDKIDGSTLIVSLFKGELIHRTRGTVNMQALTNGEELEVLKNKYPAAFSNSYLKDHSLLFEWTTPSNRIVLPYSTPELYLTGVVKHSDYTLLPQKSLPDISKELGVLLPQRFSFGTVEDLQSSIPEWVNAEGVCIYFNEDQDILKLKSEWYLHRHRLKSNLNSSSKLLDYWFSEGKPSKQDLLQKITDFLDYEVAASLEPSVDAILLAEKQTENQISQFKEFIEDNKHLSRKEFAKLNISTWKEKKMDHFVFSLLKSGDFNEKQYRYLLSFFLPGNF